MSFPVDDFGMNIRAEVKAFNLGFSPAKHLSSVLRTGDEVTVLSYTLPNHECHRPNGLGIAPHKLTIIAHTNYAEQAYELKRAFPELRIFLDPRVHCKMTLASSGKVWLGSANISMTNSFDSTIAVDSMTVYAFYMEQIRSHGLLNPSKEVLLDDEEPMCCCERCSAAEDFAGLDDE